MGNKRAAIVGASFAAAALLAAGGFVSVKAYSAQEAERAKAEACTLINQTESLYAKQRQAAAGVSPDIAVLGDSYAEGLYIYSPLAAFPYALGKKRGSHVTVHGVGGTGYVAGGPCGGQHLATRLDAALAAHPRMLIVQAGINDRGKTGVGDAAETLFAEAKRKSPETAIVAVGPFAPAAATGVELDQVAAEVEKAARAADVVYVDPRGWSFPLTEDKLHPTETGHIKIGQRLAAELPPLS